MIVKERKKEKIDDPENILKISSMLEGVSVDKASLFIQRNNWNGVLLQCVEYLSVTTTPPRSLIGKN